MTGRMRFSGGRLILLLTLSADMAFVGLHVMHEFMSFPHDTRYSLDVDGGYPETYQYIKWLWVVILLACVTLSRRSPAFLTWGCLFTYLLADDALQIHEKGGAVVAATLSFTPPFGLRAQDIGELAVSAIAGAVLFALVALAYWRGSNAFRKISRNLVLLILALVFFGMGVDMLHSVFRRWEGVAFAFGMVEDGGEMILASVILAYVFSLALHGEQDS